MKNKELLDKLKLNIAISNFEEDLKEKSPLIKENWRSYSMKKRIIAISCMSVLLASGVVFATNIENIKNHFEGLDKGVQTASKNGYVGNPEMDYIESEVKVDSDKQKDEGNVFDDIKVQAKIDDFMMDDLNLNVEFNFDFDDKLKEVFNFDELHSIDLLDLFVKDEENRIIHSNLNKDEFEEYCSKNNLDYVIGKSNENYFNTGFMNFPSNINSEDCSSKLTYNIYSTEEYPKSKKLYVSFGKIKLTEENTNNIVTLKGDWNIEVDVPEIMYNRTSESYRVISCDNKDFEVYQSKVTDTGFEIGVTISNIEEPELSFTDEERKKFSSATRFSVNENGEIVIQSVNENGEIVAEEEADEETKEVVKKYVEFQKKRRPISVGNIDWALCKTNQSYVENSNGEKFTCTMSPGRKANTDFVNKNTYDFYETFSMTKYDSTDRIKVVLYYYNNPVTIELEKVK